jgi:arylsulfatase A-like enzyme
MGFVIVSLAASSLCANDAAAGAAATDKDIPFNGVDLLPALTGQEELDPERPLFLPRRHVTAPKGLDPIPQSSLRTGDWKLLHQYKLLEEKKFAQDYTLKLFNLKGDLGETTNLAATRQEKAAAPNLLLDEWEMEMSRTAGSD